MGASRAGQYRRDLGRNAVWTGPDGRRAALNAWVQKIAREVGRQYPDYTNRTAAEAFVQSHRLSIAHAFHCKLVRKDVVAELSLEEAKADHSIDCINSGE